ncbi:P-loop containing nucleoside triphosphate hydrolase protein [Serendipita vermifera]|nr:P-loop containing nucleoside triphosphate hydrolase protein [Serendipita vermifera]
MKKAAGRTIENGPKKCTICNMGPIAAKDVSTHINGRGHQGRLLEFSQRGLRLDISTIIVEDNENCFECLVCETLIWHQKKNVHERTLRHKRKERFLEIRASLDEAEMDKNGVSLTPSGKEAFDFELVPSSSATRQFSLILDDSQARIILRSARLSNTSRQQQSPFSVNIQSNVYLSFRTPLKGTIIFDSQRNRGRFQDRLELVFLDARTSKRFAIVKPLLAIVGDQEDYELLKPTAPYVPRHKKQREAIKDLVSGEKPPALADIIWAIKLQPYEIPKGLKTILDMPDMKEKHRMLRSGFVPRELTAQTHARSFHVLLHTEEHQSSIDLEGYDQEEVAMEPAPRERLYYLPVPGLAEKRPSVIIGDRIWVKHHGSPKPHWWEGYVHVVRLDDVGLRFDNKFNAYKGQKFDIRFCLNRLTIRRMHQALDAGNIKLNSRILFPQEQDIGRKPSGTTIGMINAVNHKVRKNPPQMLAVTAIRNLRPGSAPFIVFGPPGTGKTVTIIEAIHQILIVDPSAQILACAPSNAAADIIAERLAQVLAKSQLFRLNAPSRSQTHLPRLLEPFSRKNSSGTFCVPTKNELMKFRVIVSTCLSASVPYNIGIPAGHFSHVFVDEAGQACEPEALIAIKTMANEKTNLILSGDPKQLGPIIRSSVAVKFDFGVSLLDRLTNMSLYNTDAMNGRSIVKLVKNFRSHPAILRFPNERFYKGELEAHADPSIINSLLRSSCVVAPGFPVVFHAIAGKDMREANSPSFFNVEEASLVKNYVQRLKDDRGLRLTDEHIGVISPYNAQCGKIRKILQKFASGIKVGSVEEFQGQERRIIILSTVRSSLEFVQSDIHHTLGFVAHPRRFNVAITRAQALLVVIGDPRVLSLDPLWRSFLNYIFNSGGWTGGLKPDWDTKGDTDGVDLVQARRTRITQEEEELMQRITQTVEKHVAAEDLDDLGDGYEAVERPMREAD